MKVEIWSDVVCPWCYVGKRNLERALERFAHADAVTVEWKSYELDPEAPASRSGNYVERISRKPRRDCCGESAACATSVPRP